MMNADTPEIQILLDAIAANENLIAAEKARLRVQEQRIENAHRTAALAQQRADAVTQLCEGEYYSPLEHVLSSGNAAYNEPRIFEEMRRENAPMLTDRRQCLRLAGAPDFHYRATLKNAVPSPLRQAAAGDRVVDTTAGEAFGPANIFGQPDPRAEMALLIPGNHNRASAYADVVRCALALRDDAPQDIQQVIHGSQKARKNPRDSLRRQTPHPATSRIPGTGIMHSPPNMIRLWGQAVYFDEYPCVVIMPIMTLEQINAWKFGAYEAIVLAGSCDLVTAGPKGIVTAAEAYEGIRMNRFLALATRAEIEIACQSLARVVQGLAYSLEYRQDERREDLLEPTIREQLEFFRNRLRDLDPSMRVIVPQLASNMGDVRVGKVTFQAHTVRGGAAHVAPDPLLLATKSAINWSRRSGQQLLVTGDYQEEDFDEENKSDGKDLDGPPGASGFYEDLT
jgi:hypothetical protein